MKGNLIDKNNEYIEYKTVRKQAAIKAIDIMREHKSLHKHEVGTGSSCELCKEFKLYFDIHQEVNAKIETLKVALKINKESL